jgi:hypothetical protein
MRIIWLLQWCLDDRKLYLCHPKHSQHKTTTTHKTNNIWIWLKTANLTLYSHLKTLKTIKSKKYFQFIHFSNSPNSLILIKTRPQVLRTWATPALGTVCYNASHIHPTYNNIVWKKCIVRSAHKAKTTICRFLAAFVINPQSIILFGPQLSKLSSPPIHFVLSAFLSNTSSKSFKSSPAAPRSSTRSQSLSSLKR